MQQRTRFAVSTIILLLLALPCHSGQVTKQLADGISFTQIIQPQGPDVMVVNVLKVDTKNPNVKIESALAGDTVLASDATGGRETISKLTARKGAIAGINADFFPFTGDPLGLAITNGDLVSEPFPGRSVMGISRGGWVLFDKLTWAGQVVAANGSAYKLHGINRARGADEMICYSPTYGCATPNKVACTDVTLSGMTLPLQPNQTVQAIVQAMAPGPGTSIPADGLVLSASGLAAKFINDNVHIGDKITLRTDVISQMGKNWTPIVQAVGGGPWLVLSGQVQVDGDLQKFSDSLINGRHPRTAVGMTKDKELLLVTVDGRQWISRGMTLVELAQLMQSLGAYTAINLDGGGSTDMSIRGMVVNSPSDGSERPIADALLVYGNPTTGAPDIKFSVSQISAQAGVAQRLTLVNATTGKPLDQTALSKVIWGAKGCKGITDQWGLFVPMRTGNACAVAMLGDKKAEVPITITAGIASSILASIRPDPAGDINRSLIQATLADAAGNAITGQTVSVTVTGGIADAADAVTDPKGVASFGVTWDAACDPSTRQVTVKSGKLTPVTVSYLQGK